VVQGIRPTKPWNATSIGFSDPLWGFVQRCWSGDLKLRPKVGEVVINIGREAASWDGVMPPCAPTENVASIPNEPTLNTLEHCEL